MVLDTLVIAGGIFGIAIAILLDPVVQARVGRFRMHQKSVYHPDVQDADTVTRDPMEHSAPQASLDTRPPRAKKSKRRTAASRR